MASPSSAGGFPNPMRDAGASFIRNILAHGQTPTAGLTDREADVDRYTDDLLRIIGDHVAEIQQGQSTLDVSQLEPGGSDERVLLIQKVRELEGLAREKEAKNNDLKRDLMSLKSQHSESVLNWKAGMDAAEEQLRIAEAKLEARNSKVMQEMDDRTALSKEVERWKAQAQRAEENLRWHIDKVEEDKKKMAASQGQLAPEREGQEATDSKPAGSGVPSNEVQSGIFRKAAEDSERESQMVLDLTTQPDDTHMPMVMPMPPPGADDRTMLEYYKYKSSQLLGDNQTLMITNSELTQTIERIGANQQEYVPKEEADRLAAERDEALAQAREEEGLRRDAEERLQVARHSYTSENGKVTVLAKELARLRNIKVSPPTSPRESPDPASPGSDVMMDGPSDNPQPTLADELGADEMDLGAELDEVVKADPSQTREAEIMVLKQQLESREKELAALRLRNENLGESYQRQKRRAEGQDLQLADLTLQVDKETELRYEVGQLKDKAQQLEIKNRQLEIRIPQFENRIQQLEDQVKTLESQITTLEQQAAAFRHRERGLKHHVNQKENVIKHQAKIFEDMRVPLSNKIDSLVKKLNERDDTITSLQQEISQLKAQLQKAQGRPAWLDEEMPDLPAFDASDICTMTVPEGSDEEPYRKTPADLEAENEKLKSQLDEKDREITDYAKQLSDIEVQADDDCDKKIALIKDVGNKAIDELNAEIEKLNDQITKGNEIVKEKDAKIESLISDGNKLVAERDTHIKSLEDEIARLKMEIQELRRKNTASRIASFNVEPKAEDPQADKIKALQQEIEELKETLKELTEWSDGQQADIERLNQDISDRDQQIDDLEEEIREEEEMRKLREALDRNPEAHNAAIETKEEEIEQLNNQLAGEQVQNATHAAKIQALNARIEELEGQLDHAGLQNSDIVMEDSNDDVRIQELESQLANLEAQNAANATQAAEAAEATKRLEEQLTSAEAQNATNIAHAKEAIQRLEEQIAKDKAHYESNFDAARARARELEGELAEARLPNPEIARLQHELQELRAQQQIPPTNDPPEPVEEAGAEAAGSSQAHASASLAPEVLIDVSLETAEAWAAVEAARANEAEVRAEDAEAKIEEAEARAEEAEARAEAADTRAEAAERKLGDLEAELGDLREELKAAEQTRQELNRILEEEKLRSQGLDKDLDKTKGELSDCLQRSKRQAGGGNPDDGDPDDGDSDAEDSDSGDENRKIESLKVRLGEANDHLVRIFLTSDSSRLKTVLNHLSKCTGDDIKREKEELGRLGNELTEQLRVREALINSYVDIQGALEAANTEVSTREQIAKNQVRNENDKVRRQEDEIQRFNRRSEELIAEQKELKKTLQKLAREERDLEDKIKDAESEVMDRKTKIKDLEDLKIKDSEGKIRDLEAKIKDQRARQGNLEIEKQSKRDELARLREATRVMEAEAKVMMADGATEIQSRLDSVQNDPPEFERRHKTIVEELEKHRDDMRTNRKRGKEIAERLATINDVEAKNKLELDKAKEAANGEDDPELLAKQAAYDDCRIQDGPEAAALQKRKEENDAEVAAITAAIEGAWERRVVLSKERVAFYEKLKEFSGREAFLLNETRQLGADINRAVEVEMALRKEILVSKAIQVAEQGTGQETRQKPDTFANEDEDEDDGADFVSVSSDLDYQHCLHIRSSLVTCRVCDRCLRHRVKELHHRREAFWLLTIYLLLDWLVDQLRVYFRFARFVVYLFKWFFQQSLTIPDRFLDFIDSRRSLGSPELLSKNDTELPPPTPRTPSRRPEVRATDVIAVLLHILFLMVVQVYITAKRERFLWLYGNPSSTSAYMHDLRYQLPHYRWFLDVDPRFMVDGAEVGAAMVRVRGEFWGGICAAYFYALDYLDKVVWFLLQRAFGWEPSFPAD